MFKSFHLLFSHVQFSLIHGPNIPGSYAILFFTVQDFTFTTSHIHNWVSLPLSPATSCFLELLAIALCSSPGAYWTPWILGVLSSSVISFCVFILIMGSSWQEYWSGLPFPSSADHVLSELSTMTHPSWVAPHSVALSFLELYKPLCHNKVVVHEGETD